MSLLLRIAALVAFVLILVGYVPHFSLLTLALALWLASTFVGDWPASRPRPQP